jgi:6-phosphofructokinase 1
VIKYVLYQRLRSLGIGTRVNDQEIGYELRCVDPCAFDIDYTRNLGFSAVDYLESGGTNAMITIQGDQIVPCRFEELKDPETGKTRVRMVDTQSLSFKIAREYMIRLDASDLEEPEKLRKLAQVCNLSPEDFRREFAHVVEPQLAMK